MIKVLHIIQAYGGGISTLVKNLIVAADKEQIKQDVISFAYNNAEEYIKTLEENNAQVFLMPRPRIEGYKKFKSYVLEVLKNGEYDVVHCHSDGWRSSIFRKLSKKADVKTFCIHAHRTANNPGFVLNCKPYLLVNRYISKKNADIKFTCGRDAAKFIFGKCEFTTIPNGIDLDKALKAMSSDKKALRKSLSVKDDEILIFHVGQLVAQKNHQYIIKIAEELRSRGLKFKILLVGSGYLEDKINFMINDKSLVNEVKLIGRRNDIFELINAAQCVILPSTSEGLPTIAMESQIMRTPCFASDCVTDECDLGLGLVKFLRLNSVDNWINAITSADNSEPPETADVVDAFERNAYTSTGSAERYLSTLKRYLNK